MIRISVVTPCFNCVEWIEETILSIINQKFDGLEYIVVDGGSTDGTLQVIEAYAKHIKIIISEQDEGQYHAIAKGFNLARGNVMCWVNAGDILHQGALKTVATIFDEYLEVQWLEGRNSFLSRSGMLISVRDSSSVYPNWLLRRGFFNRWVAGFLQQENMFWRRSLYEKAGGISIALKLAADYELWLKFSVYTRLYSVDVPLGSFRLMPGEQRSSLLKKQYDEEVLSVQRHLNPMYSWVSKIFQYIPGLGLIFRICFIGIGHQF